jgi:hypothetical protein
MYTWGNRSLKNINTVNDVLQVLAHKIISRLTYDVGVLNTGGKRTPLQQNEIFKAGNSKCDGYVKKSYHQTGMAIDFVPYVNGKFTWSNGKAFLSNAKVILECWAEMEEASLTGDYYLHWGGYWGDQDLDGDQLLEITDKLGWDMAHFELRNTPQSNQLEIKV